MANNVQDAAQYHTLEDLLAQVQNDILQTRNSELVYNNVNPEWGSQITDSLIEHEEIESSRPSINYNSLTQVLWIKIAPTEIHGCHLNWFIQEMYDWRDNNLINREELRLLKLATNKINARFSAPYQDSKTPNLMIKPSNQNHPSLVIETGWTESWPRMLDDTKLWLVGGRPDVNVMILLNWLQKANTNQVEGFAGVYVRDTMGKPYLRQRVAIFPDTPESPIQITWGELFGTALPQDRNPAAFLPLSIDNLRVEARDALVHMNMVPAV